MKKNSDPANQPKKRGRPRIDAAGRADVEQVRLPLPAGGKARIQAALDEGESVLSFLRAAISPPSATVAS